MVRHQALISRLSFGNTGCGIIIRMGKTRYSMRTVVSAISKTIIISTALLMTACQPVPIAADGLVASSTAAMQTVEALSTQLAKVPPATLTPTQILTKTPEVVATETPAPTASPLPSSTATQAATLATPWNNCDSAELIYETIIDGAELLPGTKFTKSWTLMNTGTCTWNSNYKLVFESGEAMSKTTTKPLTVAEVPPGEMVTVTVDMVAPETPGEYTGFWRLSNSYGQLFGLTGHGKAFWIYIKVGPATKDDFAVLSAPVSVYPSTFKGYCGNGGLPITFTGYIKTNKAGIVKYHWEGFGMKSSNVQEVVLIGADQVRVTYTIKIYTGYHENSVYLYIDEPNHQAFDRVKYDINCLD